MGAGIISRYEKRGNAIIRMEEGRNAILSIRAGDTFHVSGRIPENLESLRLCEVEVDVNKESDLLFCEDVVLACYQPSPHFFACRELFAVRRDRCQFDINGLLGPFLDHAPRMQFGDRDFIGRIEELRTRPRATFRPLALSVRGMGHASALLYPDEVLVTSLDEAQKGYIIREVCFEGDIVNPRRDDRWLDESEAA